MPVLQNVTCGQFLFWFVFYKTYMNIQNNNNTYFYPPTFTSCSRDVCNAAGQLLHRNDTCLFRTDITNGINPIDNWNRFTEYLGNKYKNCSKVNIYSLSSSAGDEVYSLVMKLLQKYGDKEAEKFFPIMASDYDPKIINMAQKGFLPMFEPDENLINKHTGGKFNEYFEIVKETPDFIKNMNLDFDFIAKVKDKLKNKVVFKVADATEECKIVNPDNSIVMVRNFWPYLKDENQRIKLADDLYKSLGKNSAVVIGNFDDTAGAFASKNLYDAGFLCNMENYSVFEKAARCPDYSLLFQ